MTFQRYRNFIGNGYKAEVISSAWRSRRLPVADNRTSGHAHLLATYRWLCTAQDADPDGGVAAFFDLLQGQWSRSYPETTGYIIPTLLNVAEVTSDPEPRRRALRMADWEIEVQMEDGAVLSGLVGGARGPAVFNTGQAVFGWIASFQETGATRYRDAALAAAEWLIDHQDANGSWRRQLSLMTSGSAPTYNARCAWALAYAGVTLGEVRYLEAARRNCEWVINQQNALGWFANAGFTNDEVPLLHTVSYVIEGLLGVSLMLDETRYLDAARRAVDAVVRLWEAGQLKGRLDEDWSSPVSWRCPTGDAQIAVVLHRLDRRMPGHGYGDAARAITAEVSRMQLSFGSLLQSSETREEASPLAGGVPGSFPIWGQYMRFCLPNWAAKFHLDALMLDVWGVDERPARQRNPEPSAGRDR